MPDKAWFQDDRPEVEGFEFPECFHGQLWQSEDNIYACVNCTHIFEVKDLGPEEPENLEFA